MQKIRYYFCDLKVMKYEYEVPKYDFLLEAGISSFSQN